MSIGKAEFQQRMQAIQQSYLASLGLTVLEFQDLWQQLTHSENWRHDLQMLMDRAHKLAGSANTFHLPQLAVAAKDMQNWFADLQPGQLDSKKNQFEQRLVSLQQLVEKARDSQIDC